MNGSSKKVVLMAFMVIAAASLACQATNSEWFQAQPFVDEVGPFDDPPIEDPPLPVEERPETEDEAVPDEKPPADAGVTDPGTEAELPEEESVVDELQPITTIADASNDCISGTGGSVDCTGVDIEEVRSYDGGESWIAEIIPSGSGTLLDQAEFCFFFDTDNDPSTGLSGLDIFGAEIVTCSEPDEPLMIRTFSSSGGFLLEGVGDDLVIQGIGADETDIHADDLSVVFHFPVTYSNLLIAKARSQLRSGSIHHLER